MNAINGYQNFKLSFIEFEMSNLTIFKKFNFWTFFDRFPQCVTGRKLLEIAGRGRVELEGGSSKGMD